ncbi:MAG: hypothetical protein ACXW4K_11245, partial [Candidatus Deferrimicrobiaceae bacterium]
PTFIVSFMGPPSALYRGESGDFVSENIAFPSRSYNGKERKNGGEEGKYFPLMGKYIYFLCFYRDWVLLFLSLWVNKDPGVTPVGIKRSCWTS